MLDREIEWKKKRCGHITSSKLKVLMTGGRGKNGAKYGDSAIKYLYDVKRERRIGKPIRQDDLKNFLWGHEHEPTAIEWLRNQTMYTVKDCARDFDEVVFVVPFDGFGDAPDFYVYDSEGKLIAVGEIKCPVSESKFEELMDLGREDCVDEYKEQFSGHLMAHPDVDEVWYLIYDATDFEHDELDERDPMDESRGILHIYKRSEFTGMIEDIKQTVVEADSYVDRCLGLGLKVRDINTYVNES